MGQVGVYPQSIQFPAEPVPNLNCFRKAGAFHRFHQEFKATANLGLTNNHIYARPFVNPKKCLISQVAIRVITASAGKFLYWGVYDDNNTYPNRLVSQGSVSGSAAVVRIEVKDFVLNPGLYWTAIGANFASVTHGIDMNDEMMVMGMRNVVDGFTAFTDPSFLEYVSADITAGMPDPFPVATEVTATITCPSFWLYIERYL
ncbi:MAG: hypothetical protein WC998_08585 [Candidatus Paceibacterota bacterium]|jgi:hypothetical protein